MAMNRGEWSELYVVLSILDNEYLNLCDESLNIISNDTYKCCSILLRNQTTKIEYRINDSTIEVFKGNNNTDCINRSEIRMYKDILFNRIMEQDGNNGAFEIDELAPLLDILTPAGFIKSGSRHKDDITLIVFDKLLNSKRTLTYSIKSMLGSPATLLNASDKTNFVYKISNFDATMINEVNNIETASKLIDRYNRILSLHGEISFLQVENFVFNQNLKLINENMPTYLGNVLLNSYSAVNRDLKPLFIDSNLFDTEEEALASLSSLLKAISFGMFPGVAWDGLEIVNGGLIIVKRDSSVVILDKIYHPNYINSYLLDNTKLDSPSSSRYHMLELYENNGSILFTLNLQIRYRN